MSFQLAASSSDSEDETSDEKKSSEVSKDSTASSTSKNRFGKPVSEPDLASDIKGNTPSLNLLHHWFHNLFE